MQTPTDVLMSHTQHYQKSCAASGMELLLKLHALVPLEYRELQDRYGDTNIGFEKLGDLSEFGIIAKPQEIPLNPGLSMIEAEVRQGRFPLVSLFSEGAGWHIWIGTLKQDSLHFLSKAFRFPQVLEVNLGEARSNSLKYRNGTIDFVTYRLDLPS